MTYLFISDLHLSPDHPRLVRGLFALLEQYQHQNTQLYILGDWFNAWIGDDQQSAWLDDIICQLKNFSEAGNHIYFLAGNRDFALGQAFLSQFNAQLLPEISYLNIGELRVRLEHGDLLCTDDISYQRFRRVIRQPLMLRLLKATPLSFRTRLAQGFRKKSQQINQIKSYDVMDVNQSAVETALAQVDIIIHGHTHRPNLHQYDQKQRFVLGDWRADHAKILELRIDKSSKIDMQFIDWKY